MIELKGVSKTYGPNIALQPLTLSFASSVTSVLLGQPNAGKTTILQIIAGLTPPTTGNVHFHGELLSTRNLPILRQRLGYVAPDGALFPHLTASENVSLMARHLNWTPNAVHKRLHELCDLTRTPRAALQRYPHELTAAQRQRIAFMRALMLRPAWMLLDDPFGGLDPIARSALLFDFKWVLDKVRPTVILSTRDLFEAAHFAGTIVLLDEGRVVQQGTFHDLEQKPNERFVTEFVQSHRFLVTPKL